MINKIMVILIMILITIIIFYKCNASVGSKIFSDLFFNYRSINRSYLLGVSHKYV